MTMTDRRWHRLFRQNGDEGVDAELAKDRGVIGRVLFVDAETPRVDMDAGSYAVLQEIRMTQGLGYKVTPSVRVALDVFNLFDRKASDNVLYGAGFQYQLTERFSAGIELNGFTPLKQPQNHSLLTNMGLTYILTKNFQVQGSLGRTLRPDSFGGPKVLA